MAVLSVFWQKKSLDLLGVNDKQFFAITIYKEKKLIKSNYISIHDNLK